MRWKLKMALEKARLNQIQLVHLTGLSEATISRIVCGYRDPKHEEMEKIARVLGIKPEKILGKRQGGRKI